MLADQEFFATCPAGFEATLAEELKKLHIKRTRPLKGGVAFYGPVEAGMRACLWLRSASRVLMVLDRVAAYNADALYREVYAMDWQQHIRSGATIAVTARGTNKELRNSKFTALKVKDAVCDSLRDAVGSRPDVQPDRPDVALWVAIHGKKATISIDFAGESLHRRGYRQTTLDSSHVEAPLKEALAAGILLQARFGQFLARTVGKPAMVVDPVCGSGTFVIEAAMMAVDMAPGLLRDYWGFEGWAGFDEDVWSDILAEADDRLEAGQSNVSALGIVGFDVDGAAVEIARENARRAGLSGIVRFEQGNCENLGANVRAEAHRFGFDQGLEGVEGFVAMNPPYGVRLLSGGMESFYEMLRVGLESLPKGWTMVAITPDASFDVALDLDADDAYPVYNGALEATVSQYTLGTCERVPVTLISLDGAEHTFNASFESAQQFADRFRKVAKLRRKWAKREDIEAYRIYDADLPDYSLAIDFIEGYDARHMEGVPKSARVWPPATTGGHLVISEYQAPREIDPVKATRRYRDACEIAKLIMGVSSSHTFEKVRRQDRGGSQYAQECRRSHLVYTVENGHVFELDLGSYLDTGLFLDHRVTRALVGKEAEGAHFLNLFAYTGTATVYAAQGGAASTTTVDLSQTYLDWAQRNMLLAGQRGRNHTFVKADTMEWLEQEAQRGARYDLVFVDPPTFSNSKSMGERTWDIQRDHVALLCAVKNVLAPEGEIVFSGNLRSFKLAAEELAEEGLEVTDITKDTIPEDFARNPKIHFCYTLKRA